MVSLWAGGTSVIQRVTVSLSAVSAASLFHLLSKETALCRWSLIQIQGASQGRLGPCSGPNYDAVCLSERSHGTETKYNRISLVVLDP